MKKVVLLGDSIREAGYGSRVPEMLGQEYTVYQPKDNCRYAQYTLRMLFEDRENIKDADVIYWNNGLWDIGSIFGDRVYTPFTPLPFYVETMSRIADLLLRITPNVIFATITPVSPMNPMVSNAVIDEFNAAVVPILRKKGIIISDLHAVVAPHLDRYIRKDDLIHLTDEAIEVCASFVCNAIRSVF